MKNEDKNPIEQPHGVSPRDYFAAKVLQGIYSNNEIWMAMCMVGRNENKTIEEYVAQNCYIQADAMMKERERIND